DGYIVDHKLTRPNGTFAFHGIPPGRYWIAVTFPTMIAGYKCAWQVAVEVNEGENIHVELNGGNLAIPAY
ncbi:MAG TPA: carboxypeptidase-like regulatory domain-containing protein, partial [Desulfosarcina sp.]|nr:carboxypeptidase-like regulatory domain-containing protein [Desulfosarcina sp.]